MTSAFGGQHSIQLSYGCVSGAIAQPDNLKRGNRRENGLFRMVRLDRPEGNDRRPGKAAISAASLTPPLISSAVSFLPRADLRRRWRPGSFAASPPGARFAPGAGIGIKGKDRHQLRVLRQLETAPQKCRDRVLRPGQQQQRPGCVQRPESGAVAEKGFAVRAFLRDAPGRWRRRRPVRRRR